MDEINRSTIKFNILLNGGLLGLGIVTRENASI